MKYWLQTDHPDFPEYHTRVLYEFEEKTLGEVCRYRPIVKALPTLSDEILLKGPQPPTTKDHQYHVRVELLIPPDVRFEVFRLFVDWDDSELPVEPGVLPSCDAVFVLDSQQTTGWEMTVTPAPLQACS